ncbi:glycoside hydrolase family 3 C-terminal domain-containing protein [bacterium BMS3Abin03]|nr:glycoside hydrolase family 3 C-terminal domain-containing protein [bacterium BMS3Abin03]
MRSLIFSLLVLVNLHLLAQEKNDFPFLDTRLSIEERVNDLVGRLTLEEKISQMMNAAPPIERLGIPAYNWWNECLHGVARAGLATVFPQAIGLGATWDEELMLRVATTISDEARAKHHNFVKENKRFIYQGLTFWSPNINIFRDPRWGRGQETYGEDPFLTGRLAVQFIRGLQGNDPKYFKTIATVKHFAVHSGPEPERHYFDATTDERDFREIYLPQFKMGIMEGKAYSVMCAYNRYEGEACCGSRRLLIDILRNEWNFDGYVVSDCGAIGDIYRHHKIVQTPEEAAALAVISGCDLECSNTYEHLNEAVKENLITENEINVAVKRLFTARFKLGMFDPPEMVEYTKIPYSIVDSKEHKELALETARESIVLLKNENNLLPLKKDVGTIAVIGPNSDEWLMLLGNYNGIPSDPITPLRGIKEKLSGHSKVLYARGCELAEGLPYYEVIPSDVFFHGNVKGLNVQYYNNKDLNGDVLFSEVDNTLNADWKEGAPRDDMDDDNFSVRWSGELIPIKSGQYQLGIISTCNTDLYLNDSVVANTSYHFRNEYGDPRLRKADPVFLEAGKKYKIKVEAKETYGDAQVQLVWSQPKDNIKDQLKKEALQIAKQSDVIIMCMGLTARMEGEEMDIELEGFDGGDRIRLDLPDVQQELIKEIYALGKPVVLVLLNGSALAVNWSDKNIPAIIEAWYPGQAGGTAIADVLFGDYNPGGKLPVTFYKSVEDLPLFEDYNLTTHTYRYFKGEPLYPFGYGLSYTSFSYDNLKLDNNYSVGDTVKLSVDVRNTGKVSGDEVVQVYISDLDAPVRVPIRSLKVFKRIHLKPGEVQTIDFSIVPDAFSIINDYNERVILPGKFEIYVGGGQPDSKGTETGLNILKANLTLR